MFASREKCNENFRTIINYFQTYIYEYRENDNFKV